MPFLSGTLAAMLAQRALRRLWAHHVEAFPFVDSGLQHNPGVEAGELMRSWYATERQHFCAWVLRRGPPPLAAAAQIVLRAKTLPESFVSTYALADIALARLDALLPTNEPLTTLGTWVRQLREEEIDFLEGDTETYLVLDQARDRPSPRGAAWAAALALGMRPHLFGLGAAPLALVGGAPRRLFRAQPEDAWDVVLGDVLGRATDAVRADLDLCHSAEILGRERLEDRNRSSHAHALWPMLVGLGPLTRAEIARALGVTKATASHAVAALENAGLVSLRSDGAVLAGHLADRRFQSIATTR